MDRENITISSPPTRVARRPPALSFPLRRAGANPYLRTRGLARRMRLELVKRVAMVAVIPVLLAVILVTPSLMGRPTVLSAIPALIIGLTDEAVVIDVHGAVDHYLYRSIYLHLQGEDNLSFHQSLEKLETYDLDISFDRNATVAFDLYVLIADRQGNTFALNGTVFTGHDDAGDYVAMTDRDTMWTVVVHTPSDLRALVPKGEPA